MNYNPSDIESFVQIGGIDDHLRLYEKIDNDDKMTYERYDRLEKREGGGMQRFRELAIPSFIATNSLNHSNDTNEFSPIIEERVVIISNEMHDNFLHNMHESYLKPKRRNTSMKKIKLALKQKMKTEKRVNR